MQSRMIHSTDGKKKNKIMLEVCRELKELKGRKSVTTPKPRMSSSAMFEGFTEIFFFLISACHSPAVVKYLSPHWVDYFQTSLKLCII